MQELSGPSTVGEEAPAVAADKATNSPLMEARKKPPDPQTLGPPSSTASNAPPAGPPVAPHVGPQTSPVVTAESPEVATQPQHQLEPPAAEVGEESAEALALKVLSNPEVMRLLEQHRSSGVAQGNSARASGRKQDKTSRRLEWGDLPRDFVAALQDVTPARQMSSLITAVSVGMAVSQEGPLSMKSREQWLAGKSGLSLFFALISPASSLTPLLAAHREEITRMTKSDGARRHENAVEEIKKVLFKSRDWAPLRLAKASVLRSRAGVDEAISLRLSRLARAVETSPRWISFVSNPAPLHAMADRVVPLLRVMESMVQLWMPTAGNEEFRQAVAAGGPAVEALILGLRAVAGEVAVVAKEWSMYQTSMLRIALTESVDKLLVSKDGLLDQQFGFQLPTMEELGRVFTTGRLDGLIGAPALYDAWRQKLELRSKALELQRAHVAMSGPGQGPVTRAAAASANVVREELGVVPGSEGSLPARAKSGSGGGKVRRQGKGGGASAPFRPSTN